MCGRQPLVVLCPLQMRMQWQSLLWPLCLPACSSQLQSCCLESWSHSRLSPTMASMASVLTILLAHQQLIYCWDLMDRPISAVNVWSRPLLHFISETYLNFTHPSILSALLVIFSASRFLIPDSPLLVPAPFLVLDPLHGITLPFLSDRNFLWTQSSVPNLNNFFPKKPIDLPCFPFRAA